MDDLLLLEEVKREEQLLHYDSRLGLAEAALEFGHHMHERALGLILQDHVKRLGVLEHLQKLHCARALNQRPVDFDLVDKISYERLFLLKADLINFLDSDYLIILKS